MSQRLPAEPPLTVAAALRLPALRRGAPEVLAGADQLGRPVRWAHSCEARHIPGLLEGDEMLLMTGMGLGTTPADQRTFVRDLTRHRVAGVVVELGTVFRTLPDALVAEARRQRLPLVVLHREVRFVEVTRQLHTAILTRQLTVERRVTELHAGLSAMVLDGAGVPALLGALSEAIGNPVLLERGGEVVFHAAHTAPADALLADWAVLRARVEAGEEGLAAVAPVLAAGARSWGRLAAVPHERPLDGLTQTAIERTAPLVAIALGRAGEEPLLESLERGSFLQDVMTGRIAPEDAPALAVRLGLPEQHARLLPVVAARRSEAHGPPVAPREVRDALRRAGLSGLLGTSAGEDLLALLVVPAGVERPTAAGQAADALSAAGALPAALAAGPLAERWEDVPEALRQAADTAETMRDGPPRRWHDATAPDIDRLLWGLRDDERLAGFARRRLAPVLEHDSGRRPPLLPTLDALAACHWRKADAARDLNIRRQSLYARLARLQRLLDADLEDPETRLGLDLAIRALRVLPPGTLVAAGRRPSRGTSSRHG